MKEKRKNFSPKNIRQIGEMDKNHKVYIEDYVFTFLQRLQNREEKFAQVVLLVGERFVEREQGVDVIYAAIEGKNLRIENEDVVFGGESALQMEEICNKNFGQYEILGWAVMDSSSQRTFSTSILLDNREMTVNEGDVLLHFTKGESLILYSKEHNSVVKLSGYGIFYGENEAMQQYIVVWNQWNGKPLEELREEKVIQKFRKCLHDKQVEIKRTKKKNDRMAILFIVLLFLTIIGVVLLNHHIKLKNVENTINQLANTVDFGLREMSWSNYKWRIRGDNGLQDKPMEDGLVEEEVEIFVCEREAEVFVYKVQEGDSLRKICSFYYGDEEKMEDICEMNNIVDPNYIVIGQKILLP
ncbi:MAG: LysM domain-containing protein [Eubacteriales bacterium]